MPSHRSVDAVCSGHKRCSPQPWCAQSCFARSSISYAKGQPDELGKCRPQVPRFGGSKSTCMGANHRLRAAIKKVKSICRSKSSSLRPPEVPVSKLEPSIRRASMTLRASRSGSVVRTSSGATIRATAGARASMTVAALERSSRRSVRRKRVSSVEPACRKPSVVVPLDECVAFQLGFEADRRAGPFAVGRRLRHGLHRRRDQGRKRCCAAHCHKHCDSSVATGPGPATLDCGHASRWCDLVRRLA